MGRWVGGAEREGRDETKLWRIPVGIGGAYGSNTESLISETRTKQGSVDGRREGASV